MNLKNAKDNMMKKYFSFANALYQLNEIYGDNECNSYYIRPSHFTLLRAEQLIIDIVNQYEIPLPYIHINTLSDGGIDIVFTVENNDKELLLAVPNTGVRCPYIYHRSGHDYATEPYTSVDDICRWLLWLME